MAREGAQIGVKVPALKALRLRKAWTQAELAKAADVGRSTILRGESGGAIAVANARQLAGALGVTAEELQRESAEA